MRGHAYHEGLPGYDQAQLYHDGCSECEQRAADPEMSVLYIRDWDAAWQRAEAHALEGLGNVSHAEARVLRMLWAVRHRIEMGNIR